MFRYFWGVGYRFNYLEFDHFNRLNVRKSVQIFNTTEAFSATLFMLLFNSNTLKLEIPTVNLEKPTFKLDFLKLILEKPILISGLYGL